MQSNSSGQVVFCNESHCYSICLLHFYCVMFRFSLNFIELCQIGKWPCIFIALFQSTDCSKHFTIHATFTHSHTHSYTDDGVCHARRQLLITSNLGLNFFHYLAQWHFDIQSGGAGIRTSDLPITRWPALPTEPQPPRRLVKQRPSGV